MRLKKIHDCLLSHSNIKKKTNQSMGQKIITITQSLQINFFLIHEI